MSSKKPLPTEEGFTFVELLVAIMVSFFFLLGTLQIMLYATIARVQATEQSEVNSWIREDYDFLNYLGSGLSCKDADQDSDGDPVYNEYAEDLLVELAAVNDSELNEYKQDTRTKSLSSSNGGRQYTFTRNKVVNSTDKNVLQLTYYADFTGDNKTCTNPDPNDTSTWDGCISVTFVEITPDVAFDCIE